MITFDEGTHLRLVGAKLDVEHIFMFLVPGFLYSRVTCDSCHKEQRGVEAFYHPEHGVRLFCPTCSSFKSIADPRWRSAAESSPYAIVCGPGQAPLPI